MKILDVRSVLTAAVLVGAITVSATAAQAQGRGDGPVVYVESQGLAYDTIVLTPLPAVGPFQRLRLGGPTGLITEFGPGDQEFVGGRWWLDLNDNEVVDVGEPFFSCPLLGPGYEPEA